MKRTTVKLPDDLDASLRDEARRRGVTVSEVTRAAIEAYLGNGRRFRLAGAMRGDGSAVSERVDDILAEAFDQRDRSRGDRH